MFRAPSLGIDLGSESIRACRAGGRNTVISMPARIAIRSETDAIVALGESARRMIGRTPPSIRVHSPIQRGVIAHPNQAEVLLGQLRRRTGRGHPVLRPHAVIAVPLHATSVQTRAVVTTARAAGIGRVSLVPSSVAAALGSGLPIMQAGASLIVEMGADTTEIAVLSLGGVVESETIPIGGEDISSAIATHIRRKYHLEIGRPTADELKRAIGRASRCELDQVHRVRGWEARTRAPGAVELKSAELVDPIREMLEGVATALREVLERTPPELSADVAELGIHLSGGASQLTGLAAYFRGSVELPVKLVASPAEAVVRGCRQLAEDPALLREVVLSSA